MEQQAPKAFEVFETLSKMNSSEERVAYLKANHAEDNYIQTLLYAFMSHQCNFFIDAMPVTELTDEQIAQVNLIKEQIGDPTKETVLGAFYMAADTKSIGRFHEILGMLHSILDSLQRQDLIDYCNQLLAEGIDTGLTHDDLLAVWPSYFNDRLDINPMQSQRTDEGLPNNVKGSVFCDAIKGDRLIAFVTWNGITPLVALRYSDGEKFSCPMIEDEIKTFALSAGKVEEGGDSPRAYADGFILDGFIHDIDNRSEYRVFDMLDSLTKLRTGIDKRALIDRRMPLVSLEGTYVKEVDHMLIDDEYMIDLIPDFLNNPKRVILRDMNSIYETGESESALTIIL